MSQYRVWWVSARGFANEGDFVYGNKVDCDTLLDGEVHCYLISKHNTFEAAQARAEKEERKAKNACPSHEIRNYGVLHAKEVLQRIEGNY